jgi:putative membrane protein
MGFGMLFMLVFTVFIVAAAVWLVTTLTRPRHASGSDRGAVGPTRMLILGERLARGEIDVEEFRARKAALQEGRR